MTAPDASAMPAAAPPATGGCLCGAVRLRVSGPLRPVVACHCGQCRRLSGNYVAATSAPRDAVAVEGAVTWFASSETARRGFCPVCGSNLLWDGPGANLAIMAGAFDAGVLDARGVRLAGHIFCAGRGAWYDLPDHERQAPGRDPDLTTMVDG